MAGVTKIPQKIASHHRNQTPHTLEPPLTPPEETKPVAETEKPVPPHHHRAIRDISRRPSTLATITILHVYLEQPKGGRLYAKKTP